MVVAVAVVGVALVVVAAVVAAAVAETPVSPDTLPLRSFLNDFRSFFLSSIQ